MRLDHVSIMVAFNHEPGSTMRIPSICESLTTPRDQLSLQVLIPSQCGGRNPIRFGAADVQGNGLRQATKMTKPPKYLSHQDSKLATNP